MLWIKILYIPRSEWRRRGIWERPKCPSTWDSASSWRDAPAADSVWEAAVSVRSSRTIRTGTGPQSRRWPTRRAGPNSRQSANVIGNLFIKQKKKLKIYRYRHRKPWNTLDFGNGHNAEQGLVFGIDGFQFHPGPECVLAFGKSSGEEFLWGGLGFPPLQVLGPRETLRNLFAKKSREIRTKIFCRYANKVIKSSRETISVNWEWSQHHRDQ